MRIGGHGSIVAAAIAACIALSPARADVKAGVAAWQAGNFEGAIREWRPLAEAGDADAQFNLGQAYKLGRGVPGDLAIAQSWYEKAANQGHEQAEANLGLILFQQGQRQAAMPWIEKAADHGDSRAQYVLATAMFNGDFIAKDWPRAYALMTRAAAQGLKQAEASLVEMDKYIPMADRLKGVELAKQMAGVPAVPPRAGAPRTAPPQPGPGKTVPPQRVASSTPVPKATPPAKTATPPKATAPTPQPPAPKPAVSLASAGGRWRVQLGAFGSPALARSQWAALSKKIGALSGLQPTYEPVGALTRLRVGPLSDRTAADRVCAAAKAAGQACFPIAP